MCLFYCCVNLKFKPVIRKYFITEPSGMIVKTNFNKKFFLTIFFILTSFYLKPSVAFIEGWAEGRILSMYDNYAYISYTASGIKHNNLLAVDFLNKKIVWEVKTLGEISLFINVNKNRLVTIENDILIARNTNRGSIIWKKDLRKIPTSKNDATPNVFKPHIKWSNKKSLLKCIKNPKIVKWFDYTPFCPDFNNLILFRVARYRYNDTPFERDWIQIDMSSGNVIRKGCYVLRGFNDTVALVTDYRDVYLLDKKNLSKIEIEDKEIFKELISPWYRYYFNKNCVSSKWFYMFKPIYEKVKSVNSPVRTKVDVIIFTKNENRFKKFTIEFKTDYYSDIVAVNDYLMHFSKSKIRNWSKKKGMLWAEIYGLKGNKIKVITENNKKYCSTNYLGQIKKNEIFLMKDRFIGKYSIPDFKLISSFAIKDKIEVNSFNIHFQNIKFLSKCNNYTVIGYVMGNIIQTEMKSKKSKKLITFKFFNFENGNELYKLKRKLTYYKRKRKKN